MSRYDRYDDRDRQRDSYRRDDRDRYERRDRYDDRDRRDRYDRRRSPPRRGSGGGYGGGRVRERVERTKFAVVITNLSSSVTWADLKDEARKYGEVTYADCNRAKMREGVVSFKTVEDMVKCKKEMDGSEFFGKRVETAYEDAAVAEGEDARPVNNDYPKGSEKQRSRSRSPVSRGDRYNRDRSRSRD